MKYSTLMLPEDLYTKIRLEAFTRGVAISYLVDCALTLGLRWIKADDRKMKINWDEIVEEPPLKGKGKFW